MEHEHGLGAGQLTGVVLAAVVLLDVVVLTAVVTFSLSVSWADARQTTANTTSTTTCIVLAVDTQFTPACKHRQRIVTAIASKYIYT